MSNESDRAALKAKLTSSEVTRILTTMERDERTVLQFLKTHGVRIAAVVVVVATGIAAFWLTRR